MTFRFLPSRFLRPRRHNFGGLALVAMCVTATASAAGDVLHIQLREEDVSAHGIIRVRDIAAVTGTNPQAAARLGEVDLCVVTADQPQQTISRGRLIARLLLAGYDGRNVALTGADAVRVRHRRGRPVAKSINATEVETAAEAVLARSFGVPREDVDARLAMPLDLSVDDADGPVSIDVLPTVKAEPGRMRLGIRLFSGSHLEKVTSGLFDVRLRQDVVLATASLPRGTVLTAGHVTSQPHWTTKRYLNPSLEDLRHWRVRRTIRAGETITTNDLIPVDPDKEDDPIVIQTRDIVQLVARGKGITATVPRAEALQPGRVGETIRVRNMHSRRVVVGKVVSAEEVEVRF